MAHSVEEPKWDLLGKIENLEIRHYEASIEAVTELPGSRHTSEGFRRLAGYIFGGNETGESIAMTAPVRENLGQERPQMAFTMPSAYEMAQLPQPSDERVRFVEVPARTIAVIRFSGWATKRKVASQERTLLDTLDRHDVHFTGLTSLNQYNPPWTPPFMRRNEIMVEVVPSSLPEHAELLAVH